MSVTRTLVYTGVAVVVVGALLAAVPGNPVWQILNPSKTVPFAADGVDSGVAQELKIVTLLGKDAIPAILDPQFITGEFAEAQMSPRDRIIGLSINGDHRAYSTAHLSSHEAVNDTVGGQPVLVTW